MDFASLFFLFSEFFTRTAEYGIVAPSVFWPSRILADGYDPILDAVIGRNG